MISSKVIGYAFLIVFSKGSVNILCRSVVVIPDGSGDKIFDIVHKGVLSLSYKAKDFCRRLPKQTTPFR